MGGAWPTLACSHLASLLQMVPLKPSLPTSSARWLASLHPNVAFHAWAAAGSAVQKRLASLLHTLAYCMDSACCAECTGRPCACSTSVRQRSWMMGCKAEG